ncbi:hypothetical protein G4D61_16205 [Bacillus ginsengihumi]|uniref:Uncharacterized protein n=1 Tax=Heyndrickxia ginsengihumi TaxID=363870 RepID=A0A6M0PAM7_9BACI|nr:CBO0543 family protein [Heyndrickxia ginsengihumi]NEY21487.1 hypothetical protein [Heyndrickxia ginsengihumi]
MPYMFVFISIFILYTIVILMPKRLSRGEMYYTSIFAILLNVFVDIYLDLKLDLYGYFHKGVDYQMVIVLIGIFPPISMIYLNGFPYDGKPFTKISYIFIWTIISIIYDFCSVKSGLLYYRKWSLFYSALCYPFSLTFAYFNLRLIRWLARNDGMWKRKYD